MNEDVTPSERAMYQLVQQKRFLDLERVPLICNDIAEIRRILEGQQDNLVTQDQFWPVKSLVYGLVTTILISVVGAVIALVLKH